MSVLLVAMVLAAVSAAAGGWWVWGRLCRRVWFGLGWPPEVTPEQVDGALWGLCGPSSRRRWGALVLAAVGEGGQVRHYLGVPPRRANATEHMLAGTVPGLIVTRAEGCPVPQEVGQAWRLWVSSRDVPLSVGQPEMVARLLLTSLAQAGQGERLVVRWVLGPVARPEPPGQSGGRWARWQAALEPATGGRGGFADVLREQVGVDPATVGYRPPAPRANVPQQARETKAGVAGWRAAAHLGVVAQGRRRQRELLRELAGAVRVTEAGGARVRCLPALRGVLAAVRLPWFRPLRVSVGEMTGLAAWPTGALAELPVAHARSRVLPPAPRVARALGAGDRLVAASSHPHADGALALSAADGLHHLHVLGPTGAGKSTVLLNLIWQDMTAGRSVVVLDPRGDLIRDVVGVVPEDRTGDVVVIDPTDPAPVGLNPLAVEGVSPSLRTDYLLTVFKNLYADSWGPRTEDILTAGLRTLVATPDASLVALPALFQNPQLRQRLVKLAGDPLALSGFWAWFDAASPAEQSAALAPVMNKLRSFLLRAELRRIIGQGRPRFDLRDIYRRRRILLVNLAAGQVGEATAWLLGALVVSYLWQTMQGRTTQTADRRQPVMVYLDEFHNYLRLPTDLADVLAQARGLGFAITLAHQHLGQLPADLQDAVMVNARSRIVFGTDRKDAAPLAQREPRLTTDDITQLGRYHVYASLVVGGRNTPYASGQTLPAPRPFRRQADVRQASRDRWGIPADDIDAALTQLITQRPQPRELPPGRFGVAPPGNRLPGNGDRERWDGKEDRGW